MRWDSFLRQMIGLFLAGMVVAFPAGAATPMVVAMPFRGEAVLKEDGTVWTSTLPPYNSTQSLGLSNIVAISGGISHFLALGKDGNVWSWGSNQYGQLGIGSISATD